MSESNLGALVRVSDDGEVSFDLEAIRAKAAEPWDRFAIDVPSWAWCRVVVAALQEPTPNAQA
jgi:hypothetical protein